MAIIFNADAKIREGGRNIVSISREEFLKKAAKRVISLNGKLTAAEESNEQCLISTLIEEESQLFKDNKFGVGFENITRFEWFTMKNGAGLYVIEAGGDWQYPVFNVLYWDGKKFRLYTPSAGNTVNLRTKRCFGDHYMEGEEEIEEEYLASYGIYGGFDEMEEMDEDDIDLDNEYLYRDVEARLVLKDS